MPPIKRLAVVLLLLLNTASPAASDTTINAEPTSSDEFIAPDQGQEEDNFGQDPTRPLWRVDLRQAAFADDDTQSYITLIRTDAPVQLNDGKAGILALRLDVPVLAIADGDELEREGGYGDLLFGAIYIAPFTWTKEQLGLDDAFLLVSSVVSFSLLAA